MKTPIVRTRYISQRGATLAEFVVAIPVVLFVILAVVQFALYGHAKAQVYYAAYEAARTASVTKSDSAVKKAFNRALIGYFGGGTSSGEVMASYSKVMSHQDGIILKRENIDDKLVKITVDFGIPEEKQVPLVNKALLELMPQWAKGNAATLLGKGYLPVNVDVVLHLNDPAMEAPLWSKSQRGWLF